MPNSPNPSQKGNAPQTLRRVREATDQLARDLADSQLPKNPALAPMLQAVLHLTRVNQALVRAIQLLEDTPPPTAGDLKSVYRFLSAQCHSNTVQFLIAINRDLEGKLKGYQPRHSLEACFLDAWDRNRTCQYLAELESLKVVRRGNKKGEWHITKFGKQIVERLSKS